MRELFVWYRVDPRRADPAREAVDAMQRSLAAVCPGLQARLLVRREAAVETWMESYARPRGSGDRAGIDAATEAAIAAAAESLRDLIEGDRHVEAFDVVR